MATSVRIVDGVDPFELPHLLTDPAAYAVVVAGVGGFYLFTVALQAGSVNAAAAALVVGETVIPGAVGLTLLGDQIRAGWAPVAVLAFILAVAGAATIALGQVGELGWGDHRPLPVVRPNRRGGGPRRRDGRAGGP